jgi:hypothetical protein
MYLIEIQMRRKSEQAISRRLQALVAGRLTGVDGRTRNHADYAA